MTAFKSDSLPRVQHAQCRIYIVDGAHDYSGRFTEDLPDEDVEAQQVARLHDAVMLMEQAQVPQQSNRFSGVFMVFVALRDIAQTGPEIRKRLALLQRQMPIRVVGGRTSERAPKDEVWPICVDDVLPLPFDYGEALQCVRKELALLSSQAMARFSGALLDCLGDAVMITDSEDKIVWVNDHFTSLTGYHLDEVRGKKPHFMRVSQNQPSLLESMWQAIKTQGTWRGEIWNRRKDGQVYAEWLSVSALSDNASGLEGYVSIFADITERKILEQNLTRHAYHDALTGLPNRLLLEDRFEVSAAAALRQKTVLALLFLDLDGFKDANDRFGHAAGDQILIQVAQRLRANVRSSDTVARLGGDEFVCLLTGLKHHDEVDAVSQNVSDAIAKPYEIDGNQVLVSCSIGKALLPYDGDEFAVLLARADERMYAHKRSTTAASQP